MEDRKNFGKLTEVLDIPDLIKVQLKSYEEFLQRNVTPSKRKNKGLQQILSEIFPIESFDENIKLDFEKYTIGETQEKVVDCKKDGNTYSAPLYIDFILERNGEKINEKVYMGEIPIMSDAGSFIVSGAERVIVSQLHRSPGICFEKSTHSSGRTLYSYRIIPDRGSWMEVQFDINDLIYIFLDRRSRRRKFLITTFLRAVGYETNREILGSAYKIKKHSVSTLLKKKDLSKYYLIDDVKSSDGSIEIAEFEPLNETYLKTIKNLKIKKIELAHIPKDDIYLINCLRKDPAATRDEALKEIYRRMRPGDPPSVQNAKQLIERMFLDVRRYDLGKVGRFKINKKLGTDAPANERSLQKEDLMAATKYLMNLRNTSGRVDDIDHLGNRRVRTVGELIMNQCRVGLARTERLVRERMTLLGDESTPTPGKLVNPKAFASVVRDFFARNQLSQFMDQTNPLAEMTNKRRLSALGPGGLSRERAGFEVRDVHSSHYGRICPIETPEGPNIGLISSLSLYSGTNELGFLQTPYRKVTNGKVTDKIEYLTADVEENYVIAQANAPVDKNGKFNKSLIMSRYKGDSMEKPASEIQYIDVSPKQLVSAAAGLIPFLEHDDANRALMGSNMQRQSVPLMLTESPYVGTGLEGKVAKDARAVVTANTDGTVVEVTSNKITTSSDGKMPNKTSKPSKVRTYQLNKYLRTNAGTSANQRPIVSKGDKIKDGDVIADGAGTSNGELSLGKNVKVAFMPWDGYNFEDAIVVSERLVKEDVYTSIHVDEFEINARDTKLGPEEITRDIPNVSEEALRNLTTDGIVSLGSEVKPGNILVGKITPKSVTELAPEERLLRAIFGEKAADVKDSSLNVPSGKGGIVMDIRIEYSKDPNKWSMTKSELSRQKKIARDQHKTDYNRLVDELSEKLADLILGQRLPHTIYDSSAAKTNSMLVSSNRKVTKSAIRKLANKYDSYTMEDCEIKGTIDGIIQAFIPQFKEIDETKEKMITGLENGDNNLPGTIKKVKIYVASKRKLQVGDKMAGRHGNKGIIAKIVPVEDMPYMEDGTPVDILLSPLGVPSRMNVGQVLETHLGWAAEMLGIKISTPVFDGISEEKIIDLMKKANKEYEKKHGESYNWGFHKKKAEKAIFDGKTELYDGRTGEKFKQRIMTGSIYMLKLDHLVANKIHSRAVGPYSLVTQQPLGGKAQHGGQRFGEMEVWALEAYGAAYALQEMLTVKSDDVFGRAQIYESIVSGQNQLQTSRPESFNVLLKEMQSLGLDIKTVKQSEIPNNKLGGSESDR